MKRHIALTSIYATAMFFYASAVLSQQQIIICNEEDKKPISFVNVNYLLGDGTIGGNYSNEKGLIEFPNEQIDAIEISCIGYKEKKIIISKVTDTIYLIKDLIVLHEIQITKSNISKKVLLGYSNFDKKFRFLARKGWRWRFS